MGYNLAYGPLAGSVEDGLREGIVCGENTQRDHGTQGFEGYPNGVFCIQVYSLSLGELWCWN